MSKAKSMLLEAASQLFYKQGISATNIDDVLSLAGVARQTLYTHFGSKDGLVLAFLERRDALWRQWLSDFIAEHHHSPQNQLLAMFDFLQHWFSSGNFRGCAFINTAVEFPAKDHPYHQQAHQHKALVKAFILKLCHEARLSDPEESSTQFFLLMEGAIVMEQMMPNQGAAMQAKRLAVRVIKQSELCE